MLNVKSPGRSRNTRPAIFQAGRAISGEENPHPTSTEPRAGSASVSWLALGQQHSIGSVDPWFDTSGDGLKTVSFRRTLRYLSFRQGPWGAAGACSGSARLVAVPHRVALHMAHALPCRQQRRVA